MHCRKLAKRKNKISVNMGCFKSTILKIIKPTCTSRSNYGSKLKTTVRDEHQLNKIFISNRFADCSEITKARNNASVTIFPSTTLRRLHQLKYDSKILISKPLLTFQQKCKHSYGLKIIKIHPLINGTKSSSIMNQDSVFPSMIVAPMFGESYTKHMRPNP